MPHQRSTPEERFWSKVNRDGDCWLWAGAVFTDGYGVAYDGVKTGRAHRYAWAFTYGLIPAGLQVLHHCDTPLCVRPAHLFLGTPAENMADRDRKGRTARGDRSGPRLHPERYGGPAWYSRRHPEIRQGERNGRAKLTGNDIPVIRQRLAARETAATIARDYGVTDVTICNIRTGKRWAHVQ